MKRFTLEEILAHHDALLDVSGGSSGVRDLRALKSVVDLPFQTFGDVELYPTEFLKAATYARTVMMNHPFVDGNKRTGISLAIIYLQWCGFDCDPSDAAIVKFAVRIVTEKLDLPKIASWLKKHTKPVLQ